MGTLAGCEIGTQPSDGLEKAVGQLNQDLQQSVNQLNKGIAGSLTNLQAAVSDTAQPGTSAWEYDPGVVAYDVECAAKAIAPYRDNSAVKDKLSITGGPSRYLIGWLHMAYEYSGDLSGEDWVAISDAYIQCGQEAFHLYSTSMGDQGWEMVSYSRLQYAFPGSGQYYGGVIVDYGYEVMWKRPKLD